MASAYLASVLIDALRDAGQLPAADPQSTTAKLIQVMNREQRVYLMALLQRAREEYQVATEDVAISAGVTRYRLPGRAAASAVKLVELVDGDSDPIPLNPVKRGQVYQELRVVAGGDYYFEKHHLVLLREAASGTLRFTFTRRLNEIVPAEEAAEVSSISGNDVTVTGTVPTDFPTAATDYDFIQGDEQLDVLDVDQSATRSGSVLTFAGGVPSELAAGDYVALAGETPICNAPIELQNVLVLRAVEVHLRSRGDARWKESKEARVEEEQLALGLIQPRAQDTKHVIQNFNAPGWGRFRRTRRLP